VFYWIYDIPTPQLAGMFALAFVGFSWLGAIFIRPLLRWMVRTRMGTSSNEVVGYVLSCYCVFYGLLLGLLAVAAYQNLTQVEMQVTREASSLAALYQDVSAYPNPDGENLRWLLRDYCRYQFKYAWALQRKGILPEGGATRLTAFQEKLITFEPKTPSQEILHAETLRQFNQLLELRRNRLYSVTTGIPAVMWYVVIVGSLINIALVWLFDMKLISHFFLGGLLSFFIGSVIFLIAAMDNPFRGEVSIPATAFEQLFRTQMHELGTENGHVTEPSGADS
jgi:hypothetical protein